MSTHRRSPRSLLAATGLVLAFLLAGCSSGSDEGGDSDSLASGAADGAVMDESASEPATRLNSAADSEAGGANRAAVQTRAVIKTGAIAVVSDELDRVHSEVEQLVASLDGYVASEDTTNNRKGDITSSTMKLRVPVASFDTAVDAVSGMGKVEYANSGEKDVTTEVIDVASRVKTTEKSLRRLRAFLAESGDVSELIRLEEEITSREAELQSLKAQQDYLSNQTSLATLTVHLSTPEEYVAPPEALEDAGFLAGLKGGWDALVATVVVGLTILGAFLPFGVALTLVGVPLFLLIRRLRRSHARPAEPVVES